MNTNFFVGRSEYIQQALTCFKDLFSGDVLGDPRFITLIGPGGIGKTQLAMKISEDVQSVGMVSTGIIDLQATSNRSELSLLSSLAKSLGEKTFRQYFDALANYNMADELDKSKQYKTAIEAFVENCKILSQKAPIIFLLDTYETIQGRQMEAKLLHLLYRLGGRIGIVLAGRKKISLRGDMSSNPLHIKPLVFSEVEQLSRALYQVRGIDYDLDQQILTALYQRARGYPILITLAIEWILENARPEDIINIPTEQFEREMVIHIRLLQEPENAAILLMAVADRRFSEVIMSCLTDRNLNQCKSICSRVARFSFVKSREDGTLTLHDEMLRLISRYIDLPAMYKNEKRKRLVEEYYEQILFETADPQIRQTLIAEKMHYQLSFDPEGAINLFDSEIRSAIEAYEFDYCNLLLDEAERIPLAPQLKKFVSLGHAELALKQYRSSDAQQIFEELSTQFDPKGETEAFCRVLEGLAGSIISPCTIVNADPFTAADYWRQSLILCQQEGLEYRIPMILFQLGNTYVAAGEYHKAEDAYLEGLEISQRQNNGKFTARILEEMNRLYRLQQNVQKSFPLIQHSLALRLNLKDTKNLGITYYYLGNTHRDLDQFDLASEYYQKAVAAFLEIGDNFNLTRVYCDMSWLAFLNQDYSQTEEYSAKSQELASKYQFGTEISENLHISYEMFIARGDKESAYMYLDQALFFAKMYNNFYNLLDCLNHDVQRAYAKKEYERIPVVLQEMMDLEKRGFGVNVFRGRATVVYGDAYYDQEKYKDALACWKEGFTVIALYGNSRTNVELFADILAPRKAHFVYTLQILGVGAAEELKSYWVQKGLEKTFFALIEICDFALQNKKRVRRKN